MTVSHSRRGIIDAVLVKIGSPVTKGQIVASLDRTDLLKERQQLKIELDELERIAVADRQRFGYEYEQMRLRFKARSEYLNTKRAELASKQAELKSLNQEIERLRSAEKDGLGHSRDMADLVIRRDTLAQYIKEHMNQAKTPSIMPKKSRTTNLTHEQDDADMVLTSMIGDRLTRIEELKRLLVSVEVRMKKRVVVSPCDGFVVDILARPGDAVPAFTPIVSIEEARAEYVEVYVPEMVQNNIQVGDTVTIFSKRSSYMDYIPQLFKTYSTTGRVEFINPGFSPVPTRLMFRQQVFWARKLRVRLDDDHLFLPGESVRVQVNPTHSRSHSGAVSSSPIAPDVIQSTEPSTQMSPPGSTTPSLPQPIKIPAAVKRLSPFEPSGIVWLDDIQRYLVISDDTGPHGKHEHMPWLFYMDSEGNVDPDPVVVSGVDTVNDLEAIAQRPNGWLYLVSSQNISKRGKRPRNREYVLEVARQGRSLSVRRRMAFLSLVEQSYDVDMLHRLGLVGQASDGRPELNIEGAVWQGSGLLLGLKQPTTETGALLWKLDDIDRAFDEKHLTPGQLTLAGIIPLSRYAGVMAGISDLTQDAEGTLWALSTIPGVANKKQRGLLVRLIPHADKKFTIMEVRRFKGMKPEGICPSPGGKLMIVFDADDATPDFLKIDIKEK